MSRPKSKSTLQLEQEIAELEAQYEPPVEDTPKEPEAPKVAEEVEKPVEPKVADPEPASEGDEEPLSKEEETFKKRFGDLRRYSQKKEKELQDQIDALSRKLEASASTQQSPTGDILRIVLREVANDVAGGGQVSKAMQRTYGLNRSSGAPRNG